MSAINSTGMRYVVNSDIFPDLCTCGQEHPSLDILQYTGADAYDLLALDAAQTVEGQTLLLDDENTHQAAGERIASKLQNAGAGYAVLTLPKGIHATEGLADQVVEASRRHSMIIAVGSGTINDLAKFASHKLQRSYWCAPTAPSMNGFTSSIAAISVGGVKRTLPASPPKRIYADPEVIRSAPLKLIQAGYCDVMAKSVSDVDWQLDSLLFGGGYCALPTCIVARTEASYVDKPEELKQGDSAAVTGLFHGLLASGLAMSLAGSSAPASGGEHLVSHFLDMREPVTGREPELHGLQVALGILLSAACYNKLAELGPEHLHSDPLPIFESAARGTAPLWGDSSGEVLKRFELKRGRLQEMPQRLSEHWSRVRELCRQVPPMEQYLALFRRTGLALTLESLGVPQSEFRLAAIFARTIRERITVLDIAAQAQVLEAAARQVAEVL